MKGRGRQTNQSGRKSEPLRTQHGLKRNQSALKKDGVGTGSALPLPKPKQSQILKKSALMPKTAARRPRPNIFYPQPRTLPCQKRSTSCQPPPTRAKARRRKTNPTNVPKCPEMSQIHPCNRRRAPAQKKPTPATLHPFNSDATKGNQTPRLFLHPSVPPSSFTPSCLRASVPSCLRAFVPSCFRAFVPPSLRASAPSPPTLAHPARNVTIPPNPHRRMQRADKQHFSGKNHNE
jgi:hypothetical protein